MKQWEKILLAEITLYALEPMDEIYLIVFLHFCARAAFSPQRHLNCFCSNSSIIIILEGTFQVPFLPKLYDHAIIFLYA